MSCQSVLTSVIIEKLLRYPGPENRLFPVIWPRVAQKLFYNNWCQDALHLRTLFLDLKDLASRSRSFNGEGSRLHKMCSASGLVVVALASIVIMPSAKVVSYKIAYPQTTLPISLAHRMRDIAFLHEGEWKVFWVILNLTWLWGPIIHST